MNIPLLLMIPLLCGGIYIIATLLRLNFPSIKKHTSLHFSWECTNIVSYGRLYFEKNKKKKKNDFKEKEKKNKLRTAEYKACFFFPHPFLLPVSHHHYISQYFLLRQELAESVFMFWGVGETEGEAEDEDEDKERKPRDNSLKAVSVVAGFRKHQGSIRR